MRTCVPAVSDLIQKPETKKPAVAGFFLLGMS